VVLTVSRYSILNGSTPTYSLSSKGEIKGLSGARKHDEEEMKKKRLAGILLSLGILGFGLMLGGSEVKGGSALMWGSGLGGRDWPVGVRRQCGDPDESSRC
jgi:hypothetical protein